MDYEQDLVAPILSGLIAGVILLLFQYFWIEKLRERQANRAGLVRGKKKKFVLDKDFLYTHSPHNITVEKIKEEFGHPNSISNWDKRETLTYYFENAYVKFSTKRDSSSIECVCLWSNEYVAKKKIINCRLKPSVKPLPMGKARFTRAMLECAHAFESSLRPKLGYSFLTCNYDEVEVSHLYITYGMREYVATQDELLDHKIDQICISLSPDYSDIFHWEELITSPE